MGKIKAKSHLSPYVKYCFYFDNMHEKTLMLFVWQSSFTCGKILLHCSY